MEQCDGIDGGVSMIMSKWKDMECHGMMMSNHGKEKKFRKDKEESE